eukprot:XP_011606420.1 PREDICTED: probable G-protein coupled receptor 158 [Takifugu rubripes]
MAVFRLSLLLQVGLVIGSNLRYPERSVHRGEGTREAADRAQAQRRRLHHPHAVTAELPQKLEERLPKVVAAFLHSGDSTTLQHANCSGRYELTSLRGRSHAVPHRSMSGALDAVLHATNFLNMILQANRSREQSLRRDIEWYHALVRSILEGDSKIHRAVVTFGADASAEGPAVLLQATRAGGEIVLQDLSSVAHRLHNRTADTGWYHDVKDAKKKPGFRKRVLSQDLRSAENSVKRGESFIPDRSHVRWSAPYLECHNGNFVPRWLLTLSAAFYGLKKDLAPVFSGVVRVDISLQDVDIDQCSSDGWFGGTHRCNTTTMECLPIHGHGFVLDKYSCHCKTGFYHPSRLAVNSFARTAAESGPNADEGSSSDCLPCQQGCAYCKDDTPCVAQEDGALRLAVLSFQCLCLLAILLSMVLVYHFRRNKNDFKIFRYFHSSARTLWVLKVFLSRTAQRIPYMTSWRVLRLLGIILLIVCWFLVAWTSAVCEHPDRKSALIDVGYTPDGLQFSMCLLDRWDYMMAVGKNRLCGLRTSLGTEFLFLLWSVYLCYAVRTVPSAFHEPRYMAIAVHNELVLSAIFYIIRFTLVQELHPDWMLLLFFTHTHLTVTVTLGLLLIPKFLFAGTHMRDDIASEAYEDELDMGRSGSYLNSSITSAWSEHSLDPEDIREELKKLYSQLEVYKRKKMLANNPHLPKKRSSKKGLGRSLMRRITEIPESVHRQCSREDKEAGEHASNRNSICALKKNPFDPTHAGKPAKEETLKSKVFSLKKSHSSYDHVRDQREDSDSSATDKMEMATAEGSLLDTLMGKKVVKKSSENISAPSESTESVPLVCKSASAHNLSADKKPIHGRASMLQKSLSVIASAKEKTLGLTAKAQSSEDSNKKSQPKSKDPRASVEPDYEAPPKTLVSQVVEGKQNTTKGRVVKQLATGHQPTCSDLVKGKDLYDLSEVCPWEVEDLPTPSENKVQKHVSIAPKETTTVHGGSTKGSKAQQHKQKEPQKTVEQRKGTSPVEAKAWSVLTDPSRPGGSLQLQPARADVCPWEYDNTTVSPNSGQRTPSPSQASKAKEAPSKKKSPSRTAEKEKPKEAEEEKSRTKAKDKSKPKEKCQQKLAEVCPWDVESDQEMLVVEKRRSANVGAAKAKPVDVCPWDFQETPDKKDKVGKQSDPNPASGVPSAAKKADICPWDFEDSTSSKKA